MHTNQRAHASDQVSRVQRGMRGARIRRILAARYKTENSDQHSRRVGHTARPEITCASQKQACKIDGQAPLARWSSARCGMQEVALETIPISATQHHSRRTRTHPTQNNLLKTKSLINFQQHTISLFEHCGAREMRNQRRPCKSQLRRNN